MEFKNNYKFRDLLPIAVFLIFFLIADIAGLICIIAFFNNEKLSGEIIGIIALVICAIGLLSLIIILSSCVATIDEEKIETKGLIGAKLIFNINDIYKIEKKPGPKGILVFIIHGNTPQINSNKNKVKTISLFADEKREKILRHFITNPEVWETK